jgi:HlyD family secretion protein
MNSTVVQNVVTYDTIIDFDNPELKLFPGMTAYVTIPVATAENVVKVPNAALRFKPDLPPDELRKLYEKAGIAEEAGSGTSGGKSKPATEDKTGAKPGADARTDTRIVWRLTSAKTIAPLSIKTGITDHTNTELVQIANGNLKPGDQVVTGVAQSRGEAKSTSGPRRP